MSNVCSKCGRSFTSTRAQQCVCPDCLGREFTVAAQSEPDEQDTMRARREAAARRQHARMAKLLNSYKNGSMFNASGKVMFCVAVFILLFCHLVFFLDSSSRIYWGVDGMGMQVKCFICLAVSIIGAVLLVLSTRRHKVVVSAAAVIICVLGWFTPVLWTAGKAISPASVQDGTAAADAQKKAEEEIVTQEELAVYFDVRRKNPRGAHYAVFLDNQNPAVRSLVRDSLTRLLEAEFTSAYTRTNGVLYVVANATGPQRNIANVVERFGKIVKPDVTQGIYLVKFDEEKVNMVSKYPSDILSSPLNASFVPANISELQSLDAMRVRMAARSLKNANVQVLRREIRDTLVKVLSDPWGQAPDTYVELIDALVTYAEPKDAETTALCLRYFASRRAAMRDVLPSVANFLIREIPDKMVEPMVTYWLSNPVTWTPQIENLSWRVEPVLLKMMANELGIKELNIILRYLQSNGTKAAIPAVQELLKHSDNMIRFSAKTTLQKLESRD